MDDEKLGGEVAPTAWQDGFARGVELGALECMRICRQSAEACGEMGPLDEKGWPATPMGAARHQSFALADLIEESLQHETLAALMDGSPQSLEPIGVEE